MKKSGFSKFVLMASVVLLTAIAQASGGEHEGNPAPNLATLFRGANFLILVILLFVLLRKPVKDFFAARAQSMGKAVEEARKAHQAAWHQHEEINRRLKNLEEESRRMMASFREEGEEEKKKLLSQAQNFAEKIKQDAQLIADGEVKKAKQELKEMGIQLSHDLAYKMIKTEIKPEDQERLTENYLKGLKNL